MASFGDIGARAVFRRRQQSNQQAHSSQETAQVSRAKSRFKSLVLAVSAASVDSNRTLRTDWELAKVLTKPKEKREKKESTWLERMKRIHARKFGTYMFDKNNEYQFSKPKNHEHNELFFEGGNKYKKPKHMTKDERLRMYRFFGKVVTSVHCASKLFSGFSICNQLRLIALHASLNSLQIF